jgi:hypothetical protein
MWKRAVAAVMGVGLGIVGLSVAKASCTDWMWQPDKGYYWRQCTDDKGHRTCETTTDKQHITQVDCNAK